MSVNKNHVQPLGEKEVDCAYDMEKLMREYGNDVLRTAYSYVHDIHMAEDLFQEVFVKVFRKLHTFQGESSIKTWLIRITVNTCKDYLKSAYSKRVVPMMEFKEDSILSEDDFEEIEQEDRNNQIKDAVMGLPEKYRETVLLVYYHDLNLGDVAKMLDLPEGTVKSRLSRAREKLKQVLERRL